MDSSVPPDYFEVAEQLAAVLLPQPEERMINHMSILLSTPLETLRRRGLPVDRILNTDKNTDKENHVYTNDTRSNSTSTIHLGGLIPDFGKNSKKGVSSIKSILRKCKTFSGSNIDYEEYQDDQSVREYHSCEMVPGQSLRKELSMYSGTTLFCPSSFLIFVYFLFFLFVVLGSFSCFVCVPSFFKNRCLTVL